MDVFWVSAVRQAQSWVSGYNTKYYGITSGFHPASFSPLLAQGNAWDIVGL